MSQKTFRRVFVDAWWFVLLVRANIVSMLRQVFTMYPIIHDFIGSSMMYDVSRRHFDASPSACVFNLRPIQWANVIRGRNLPSKTCCSTRTLFGRTAWLLYRALGARLVLPIYCVRLASWQKHQNAEAQRQKTLWHRTHTRTDTAVPGCFSFIPCQGGVDWEMWKW